MSEYSIYLKMVFYGNHFLKRIRVFFILVFSSSPGSAALSANTIRPKFLPKINEMSFVLKTKTKNISVPLEQPEQLWSNAEFNKDLPLVLLITGWTTNVNDTNNALETIYAAYKCRGNVNFVVNIDSSSCASGQCVELMGI